MAEEVKKTKAVAKVKAKKSTLKVTESGKVFVLATFNNTLVTITNEKGETVSWSSAGAAGLRVPESQRRLPPPPPWKPPPKKPSIEASEALKFMLKVREPAETPRFARLNPPDYPFL